MTKFISWNVNGLRAIVGKGFENVFRELDADFFCLQETKLNPDVPALQIDGWHSYWNLADKKGYSGTAIYSKSKPLSVSYGIGVEELDHEGRVITLETDRFYLICVYTPNSQSELGRLPFRMRWDEEFRKYVGGLDAVKPVIICGDFNVVHCEIDAKNFQDFAGGPCFTDEERSAFGRLLDSGFIDTFRYLHPGQEKAYTWWSYRMRARQRNLGWRIDGFLISERLLPNLEDAGILRDITGSDHCPVTLTLKE